MTIKNINLKTSASIFLLTTDYTEILNIPLHIINKKPTISWIQEDNYNHFDNETRKACDLVYNTMQPCFCRLFLIQTDDVNNIDASKFKSEKTNVIVLTEHNMGDIDGLWRIMKAGIDIANKINNIVNENNPYDIINEESQHEYFSRNTNDLYTETNHLHNEVGQRIEYSISKHIMNLYSI